MFTKGQKVLCIADEMIPEVEDLLKDLGLIPPGMGIPHTGETWFVDCVDGDEKYNSLPFPHNVGGMCVFNGKWIVWVHARNWQPAPVTDAVSAMNLNWTVTDEYDTRTVAEKHGYTKRELEFQRLMRRQG